ncbi:MULTISPECIES: MmcQ/YjbR family DNA-binding protein [Paenibacillus]|uniref:MmcQ/YjbR family DNA-binding protein n=1 Tax=Paenibacillus polymyxa TaxID=1406 RepID=UPI0008B5A430|nr:MmcQ/YjbR family DNA-binding protein [Paenibacillus polymyxa]MBE3648184.1 MmcQ/YjbR family DNA-binding protein [Paenibacillus polymyxa]RGL30007.1 MmcQ/YjbR family DNA-binding protein [Paenibacillus polymyxa]UMR36483.1 MmcQ/YjbR family DNA-binding protein [Paenibacillus polymyxa]SEK06971.1 Predicted DNA-binding protein, MmcQ/YjbR family [Paenibacillus polymyxa]
MFEQIVAYGLSQKEAVKDYPFGADPLVLKVGGKMFALLTEKDGISHVSLKCDPVIAENLRQQNKAIKPGYHLNKKHWNTVEVDNSFPLEDLYSMIDHSYELVFKSLTRAQREAITMRIRATDL